MSVHFSCSYDWSNFITFFSFIIMQLTVRSTTSHCQISRLALNCTKHLTLLSLLPKRSSPSLRHPDTELLTHRSVQQLSIFTKSCSRQSAPFTYPAHRTFLCGTVEASWNVIAHALKPDFVFRRNGRVHLNRRGASVQSTTGSRVVRISGSNAGYTMFRGSVKGTGYPLHSPVSLHFPSHASPCAITFQLDSTTRSLRTLDSRILLRC
jgi:hypothetical protein